MATGLCQRERKVANQNVINFPHQPRRRPAERVRRATVSYIQWQCRCLPLAAVIPAMLDELRAIEWLHSAAIEPVHCAGGDSKALWHVIMVEALASRGVFELHGLPKDRGFLVSSADDGTVISLSQRRAWPHLKTLGQLVNFAYAVPEGEIIPGLINHRREIEWLASGDGATLLRYLIVIGALADRGAFDLHNVPANYLNVIVPAGVPSPWHGRREDLGYVRPALA